MLILQLFTLENIFLLANILREFNVYTCVCVVLVFFIIQLQAKGNYQGSQVWIICVSKLILCFLGLVIQLRIQSGYLLSSWLMVLFLLRANFNVSRPSWHEQTFRTLVLRVLRYACKLRQLSGIQKGPQSRRYFLGSAS